MRAADPKKIKTLADVSAAMNRRAGNVTLNLTTGAFEVKNAKSEVVKTIGVTKGTDAAYLINNSSSVDSIGVAADFLNKTRNASVLEAAEYEVQFAEKQDEILKIAAIWNESSPGASRRDLSIKMGRLQNELATIENKLRGTQYKYRGALEVAGVKRRTFAPASNDERVMPFPVFKLQAHQTSAVGRIVT